jgi:hypothetical protein
MPALLSSSLLVGDCTPASAGGAIRHRDGACRCCADDRHPDDKYDAGNRHEIRSDLSSIATGAVISIEDVYESI